MFTDEWYSFTLNKSEGPTVLKITWVLCSEKRAICNYSLTFACMENFANPYSEAKLTSTMAQWSSLFIKTSSSPRSLWHLSWMAVFPIRIGNKIISLIVQSFLSLYLFLQSLSSLQCGFPGFSVGICLRICFWRSQAVTLISVPQFPHLWLGIMVLPVFTLLISFAWGFSKLMHERA